MIPSDVSDKSLACLNDPRDGNYTCYTSAELDSGSDIDIYILPRDEYGNSIGEEYVLYVFTEQYNGTETASNPTLVEGTSLTTSRLTN